MTPVPVWIDALRGIAILVLVPIAYELLREVILIIKKEYFSEYF